MPRVCHGFFLVDLNKCSCNISDYFTTASFQIHSNSWIIYHHDICRYVTEPAYMTLIASSPEDGDGDSLRNIRYQNHIRLTDHPRWLHCFTVAMKTSNQRIRDFTLFYLVSPVLYLDRWRWNVPRLRTFWSLPTAVHDNRSVSLEGMKLLEERQVS
jgi:hypothetical protein